MPEKKFTRIFFATDVHGSEICFRKFLSAVAVYKADVLVLGGDITGKIVIPIVDLQDGSFRADYLGREELAKTPEELKRLEQLIADSGYYSYHRTPSEMEELKSSKEKRDELFKTVMRDTLVKWVDYAERILKLSNTTCYITGGNDDLQEVVHAMHDTDHVKSVDDKVVRIDSMHEMVSLGWSNPTPWRCPRECTEEELLERIERSVSSVSDIQNCVFNFHVPPINCGLDTVAKLDDSVDPPKFVMEGGRYVMIGAGSSSVRQVIERTQPLIDLCGHIHESRGVAKVGKTLVVNPGSEYSEGVLRGAIVNIADHKVLSWQLTAG